MAPHSELLFPPPALASCISAAVYRDTLGTQLSERDRLNYFPATPLYAVTRVFDGQLHMANGLAGIPTLRAFAPIPELAATPPQAQPTCSWSAGDIRALTVAVYPDAWTSLGGTPDGVTVPPVIRDALLQDWPTLSADWVTFCDGLVPHWSKARQDRLPWTGWAGSHRLSDWARHVTTSAALTGTGRSLRSIERRVRHWTGQSKQTIDFFAKIEDLHARSVANPDTPLAEMAAEADFSDQSHMGRAVKRATGFSPGQLNTLIATQEPFWCYRLLGERF